MGKRERLRERERERVEDLFPNLFKIGKISVCSVDATFGHSLTIFVFAVTACGWTFEFDFLFESQNWCFP